MRLIVPFPPGGPTDVIGRTAAKILSDALGQPVVVDNRPGGSGTVGLGVLAKSPADGYTIGTNLVQTTPLIAAHPSFPANTLAELIAYARAHPGKVAYGTPGIATVPHLAAGLSARRSALLPDVPTAVESGYPAISASPWFGFGGAAGLAPEQVARMHDILVKGVRDKELIDRMTAIGAEITPSASPEEFVKYMRAEHAKWGEVIRKAGVKAE